MRRSLPLVFMLLAAIGCSGGRETTTLYYDKDWRGVSSAADAAFYREVTFDRDGIPLGLVRDYYITGELQGEGRFLHVDRDNDEQSVFDGPMTIYYRNGLKASEAVYRGGKLNGPQSEWDESGVERSRSEYLDGLLHGTSLDWYESGKLQYREVYDHGRLVNNKYIECDEFGRCWKMIYESFDGQGLDWSEEQDETVRSRIEDGEYLIAALTDGDAASGLARCEIDTTREFSIEATLRKREPCAEQAACGLIWGLKNWDNYFCMVVDGAGDFLVFGYAEGIRVEIVPWTHAEYIEPGENLLKISRTEDGLFYSVNGELIGRSDFYRFFGHGLGVYVDGAMTVAVDDVTVRQDLPAEEFVPSDQGTEGGWRGSGSGVFVSREGHIATNHHVIEEAVRIEVEVVRDGARHSCSAELVMEDRQNDLAVIKINDEAFETLPRLPYHLDDRLLDVGSSVFTLGYPGALSGLGQEVKFTDGRISAQIGFENDATTYQISAPVQPGSSGGPLFDERGNIVGIVNAKVLQADNVTYAIKAGYLKDLLSLCSLSLDSGPTAVRTQPLPEQIKTLREYVVLIKVQ